MRASTLLVLALFVLGGCGHYPAAIRSAHDIRRTGGSEYMVVVGDLPLDAWPQLGKFDRLEHFSLIRQAAPRVTDRHLLALGNLKFPQLRQLSIAHAHEITDDGIQALTNFRSLEGLQLINTRITDRGLHALATALPRLKGINVMNCGSLTSQGFLRLRESETLESVGLSVEPLSPREIEEIIAAVRNVTWWIISDPRRQLDLARLKSLGEATGITIQVSDENHHVSSITQQPVH